MSLLRQTNFADFDFNVGNGAEYIIVGGDYLVFSAAGILQRISLAGPEKGSSENWRIESLVEGEVNVLYEGTFTQVEARFRLVKDRARRHVPGNQRMSFKTLLMVSLLAAASACALMGLTHRHQLGTQVPGKDQIDFSEFVDAMKLSGMDYSQLLSPLVERSKITPDALRQGTNGAITQVVPELKPQGLPREEAAAADTNGLPKYSPDLYKDEQSLPVEKANETVQGAGDKQQSESSPATLPADVEAELKKMEPEKAAEVLRKISMLTPSQMTGEALASLPTGLRELIERTNAEASEPVRPTPGIETSDEQGVPIKMIILPSKVIDSYRTHDGISSIPENSSWQARGNPTVHLPLPGGGDIQSVSDLEKFGLKP